MRYVAAYLLASLGSKDNPTKEDITKILESVGLEIEDGQLDKVRKRLLLLLCVIFNLIF